MFTNRFLITLGLLTVSLLALAAGVNASLDHLTAAPVQNSFVVYDDQGHTLYAYNGDFSSSSVAVHPNANLLGPRYLHRT
jgi:predicted lipoprotein with Yx(FWY)xxD motif